MSLCYWLRLLLFQSRHFQNSVDRSNREVLFWVRDRNDFLVPWMLELMMATADPDFNPSGLGQHLHQFRAVHGVYSTHPYMPLSIATPEFLPQVL